MIVKGNTKGLDEAETRMMEAYYDRLAEAGEEAVETAIRMGSYQNITGNLRSSIGYVIAYDGKILREGGFHKIQGRGENMQRAKFTTKSGQNVDFWGKGKFGDGSEGSQKGLEFARSLVKGRKGYVYVLVAGMEYASYVNNRGYNVMDSAELTLRRMVK